MDWNAVYFHALFGADQDVAFAVDHACFHQIAALGIHADCDIRRFDFKGPGVGDIACLDGSFFTGVFIEVLVKGGKLFFLDAAVL